MTPAQDRSSLFTNTAAQSARLITGYAVSFLLAPLMLARLGLDAFGLWAVTGALATYAGLADLGITRSLSRFVALWDAQGDRDRIRASLGLGLIAVTGIGALALGLAVALAPLAGDLLHVRATGEMRSILLASAAILIAQGYAQVLDAVPLGLQRMVPPNVAGIVGNVLNGAFSVAALIASRNLEVYAWANAVAAALAVLPAGISLVRVWKGVPLPSWPSRELVREVLGFGVKNQIGWVADLVNFQTDKIVIASLVDLRAAGAYEIAARVVAALRSAAILTISAMIPTMTAALVESGRSILASRYAHYLRRSVALAFPVFLLGCASAPFLLPAWLGQVPDRSEAILVAISLAYLVNITTGAGSTIAMADGNPGIVASNAVLAAALNVALTVVLAPLFGLWGVLAGTFTALSATSLLFVARFQRVYAIPVTAYLRAVGPPLALAAGVAAPLAAAGFLTGGADDRAPAAAGLVAVGALYVLAYWVGASRLGFLPERLALRRLAPQRR